MLCYLIRQYIRARHKGCPASDRAGLRLGLAVYCLTYTCIIHAYNNIIRYGWHNDLLRFISSQILAIGVTRSILKKSTWELTNACYTPIDTALKRNCQDTRQPEGVKTEGEYSTLELVERSLWLENGLSKAQSGRSKIIHICLDPEWI